MKSLHSSVLRRVFSYSLPVLLTGVIAGCASTSDFEALQKRVDELQATTTHASSVAEAAHATASEASIRADSALTISKQARVTSSEASAVASRADKTAGEASNTANNALSVSDQARAVSSEALTSSQRATQAATEAKVKAYEASTKASSASFTANSLKSRQDATGMPESGSEASELPKGVVPMKP
jgi:hypothetical protein